MRRKLTPREWIMLGVLAVLAVVAGYVTLFYMPTTDARDTALAETETCRDQIAAARVRLAEKQRMERELDALFAENPDPMALAEYDNLKPIMVELNSILAATQKYSLSFATVDDTQNIIRREIFIDFTCGNYATAKAVLQRLHDSTFRCMLNNVTISDGQSGSVTVKGSIVYFECRP